MVGGRCQPEDRLRDSNFEALTADERRARKILLVDHGGSFLQLQLHLVHSEPSQSLMMKSGTSQKPRAVEERLTNPLLTLPKRTANLHVPQLWPVVDVSLPQYLDNYPLEWQAKVLGLTLPEEPVLSVDELMEKVSVPPRPPLQLAPLGPPLPSMPDDHSIIADCMDPFFEHLLQGETVAGVPVGYPWRYEGPSGVVSQGSVHMHASREGIKEGSAWHVTLASKGSKDDRIEHVAQAWDAAPSDIHYMLVQSTTDDWVAAWRASPTPSGLWLLDRYQCNRKYATLPKPIAAPQAQRHRCLVRMPFQAPVDLMVQLKESEVIAWKDNGWEQVIAKPTTASFNIIKTFMRPSTPSDEGDLAEKIVAMDKELTALETKLEPTIKKLFRSAVEERVAYDKSGEKERMEREKRIIEEHHKLVARRKEMDLAWQRQLEQDMDAVCAICDDGEVTPDNQILFCESCNVAVHQYCYGVEKVPAGDYYCVACRYLGRDQQRSRRPDSKEHIAGPLPIVCELCPHRQGAFIRTDMKTDDENGKWVHAMCAKWQGLDFIHQKPDLVEDVTDLKILHRRNEIVCTLCLGERGSMNRCRVPDCETWMHVTCARAVGTCDVVHGETVDGQDQENGWTLLCTFHSRIPKAKIAKNAMTTVQLVELASQFPPEPKPEPLPVAPMPFNTANGTQRRALLADPKYESALLRELTTKRVYGYRCECCDHLEDTSANLTRCTVCLVTFCQACSIKADKTDATNYKCVACTFVEKKEKAGEPFEEPQCIACYQKSGFLRRAFAHPVGKAKSKMRGKKRPVENPAQETFFTKPIWAHGACTFWNDPRLKRGHDGRVDCSNVVMANGKALVQANTECFLCGQTGGLKVKCAQEGCRLRAGDSKSTPQFHVTCAREAGLEVGYDDESDAVFYVKCYRHGSNEYNLRARLEDLLEIEKRRSGKKMTRSDAPMKFSDAARLLNASIHVMRTLGWAWRWAEWFVDYDSTWEPLLEPGQKEQNMTKKQLKIIDSTRESRCMDARRCRLAALGVALRDRRYDTDDDFDRASIERALLAVLNTKSLVGPIEAFEKEFLVDWLGRAYRSKSRILGYGDYAVPIGNAAFCSRMEDGSSKASVGAGLSIPGTIEFAGDTVFEEAVVDIDDFMRTEVVDDPSSPRKPTVYLPDDQAVEVAEPTVTPKRRGRPPKAKPAPKESTKQSPVVDSPPSTTRSGRVTKQRNLEYDDAVAPKGTSSVSVETEKRSGKRRGRPPKSSRKSTEINVSPEKPKKRRGRPPKSVTSPPNAETSDVSVSRLGRHRRNGSSVSPVVQPGSEDSAAHDLGGSDRDEAAEDVMRETSELDAAMDNHPLALDEAQQDDPAEVISLARDNDAREERPADGKASSDSELRAQVSDAPVSESHSVHRDDVAVKDTHETVVTEAVTTNDPVEDLGDQFQAEADKEAEGAPTETSTVLVSAQAKRKADTRSDPIPARASKRNRRQPDRFADAPAAETSVNASLDEEDLIPIAEMVKLRRDRK